MTNYIGIDISLSSTGLFILKKDGTELYFNYMNKNKLTKWHKTVSFVKYRTYKTVKSDIYSDSELLKILAYNSATDLILEDILNNVEPKETIISIEGYSYSSRNTSALIDIVAFSSLLRNKLAQRDFNNIIIMSPSSLKKDTCEMVYPPKLPPQEYYKNGKPKKRVMPVARNNFGIAGGNFTKHDMCDALLEDNNNLKIKQILLPHKKELQLLKNIPKPLDDIIDAILLALTTKNKLSN